MTKPKRSRTGPVGRDFSGVITQFLVSYLRHNMAEGTLEHVLHSAGETRSAASLSDPSTWCSYAQFRKLLETAAEVMGGREALGLIGRHMFDRIRSPELMESIVAFGSPSAAFAAFPELNELAAPAFEMRTEDTGPNECRMSIRVRGGHEPFPELCAFEMGLVATIPSLFGYPVTEVVVESCQCDGAVSCQALLRWGSPDDDTVRVSRAEIQSRLSQARLDELQHTVAELVSGGDLETVLTRVMAAAGRAVTALSYILAVHPRVTGDLWTCVQGIESFDAPGILETAATGPIGDLAPHMFVTEVASDRHHYGSLVAIRPENASFEPLERVVLESYARLAASALESEAAIASAREQAATAQALLSLSSALAALTSTEEMVLRLAQAVPSVIGCDRVAVWLSEPGGHTAQTSATLGFDPPSEARMRLLEVPIPARAPETSAFRHGSRGDCTPLTQALAAAGSLAALSYPIAYGNELYGWITVDVVEHPERLDDDADITERLRGLASQAAIAIRNARLLDEIRHQALHDSLTGLPNRVLVLDRVTQALARAKREHFEIAVMFIDLDGFKEVNDTLGHAMGDRLLQAVAARLAGGLRESDTIARLGGDEFVVLIDLLTLSTGPEVVAANLLDVLARPFHLDGRSEVSVRISASVGIAVGRHESAEELLRDADIALYAAKDAGKNCFVAFEAKMRTALRDRHQLDDELMTTLGADQVSLSNQPIFSRAAMPAGS